MKNSYDIIKRPLITEKSMKLVEEGKYTFEVAKNANKIEIKKAIEEIFKVDVIKVNVSNVRPKKKRMGQYQGFKPGMKKAIVRLAVGQRIEAFDV